jgi:transcriptional regulator GlxA family with amidase domain
MAGTEAFEPNGASMGNRPVHVSLVVFPESDPSIVYGVFDTLWAAGRIWNSLMRLPPSTPIFEPRLVAAETSPLRLVTGVTIIPQDGIADVQRTDVVFVPNVMVETAKCLRGLDRRLLGWIRDRYEQGSYLYAACGGSLVLAEAGLLDGEETTTHWGYVPLFRKQFPNVRLRSDRILVQAGDGHRMLCCGGSSSWQDLTLMLVAKHAGNEEAIRISKLFLYQWHREGQLPYAAMIKNVDHGDAVVSNAQVWLVDNYQRADVVAELVRRSGVPKRTFDRRFKAATGYAPLSYVQALRIEEAKQMLETTEVTAEAVGREVGYEDPASFRRLFRRLTGMAPAGYRRKFQVPASASAATPAMPTLRVDN